MSLDAVKIHLGCGKEYINGFVNVDSDYDSVADVVIDLVEYLKSMKDNSVSEVYARHVFEHLTVAQLNELLVELDRIMIDQALLRFIVPHFSNPYYYSDPTHKTFWGLYSADYYFYSDINRLRSVPKYLRVGKKSMCIVGVKLLFRFLEYVPDTTSKPISIILRSINKIYSKIMDTLVNGLYLNQEIYELFLSKFISAYEIDVLVKKNR